jgi:amidase
MIRVARDRSVFALSAHAAPVARIQLGDTLVLETKDCFSDQVQSADAAIGGVDWEQINPATGPVFVEGVEAGDVLSVRIERIAVADHGVMAVSGDFGVLSDQFEGISF